MEANVSLIITAIIFVLLIIILPIYNVFTRQDDMSYNLILKATANFADKVRTTGVLDYDTYQDYLIEIDTTQNTFNVEMEVHKSYLVAQSDGTYKEEFIIMYTDEILEKITPPQNTDKVNNEIILEKGEKFFVRVNNTNITKADSFLASVNFMETTSKIDIDYGGLVLVNTIKK